MQNATDIEPVSKPARLVLSIAGIVGLLLGFYFVIAGSILVVRGGSWYYLLAGLALCATGVQILRRHASALLIYLILLVVTVLWALWENGFDFWSFHARVFMFSMIGMLLALLYPLLRPAENIPLTVGGARAVALVLLVCNIALGWGMFIPHGQFGQPTPVVAAKAGDGGNIDWSAYGGSVDANRFSAATQITRDNVKTLQPVWTFRTGDTPINPTGGGAEDQQTPLQVGKTLYLCTPHNTVIAVDAATGKEQWRHDFPTKTTVWVRCRGLAYFDAMQPLVQPTVPGSTPVAAIAVPAECRRRIYMNTIDGLLVALDADNGKLCADFGKDGIVDLKDGLGNATPPLFETTSPPAVAGTTVVVGGRVADNVKRDMPGGVIRGYDVISGKMKWAFDPGNPKEHGEPASGKTFTRSTPNVWAQMTYDPSSNTIYMPLGNASIDLWGVQRTKLDEMYTAVMLALDANTGVEKWHYQTVRHDLWDFDLPMQPTLIDFPVDGKSVPALIFGTKAGQVFVLDRHTGKPLTEVVERPVKPAKVPDEPYAKSQPVSVGMPQIGAEMLKESDMWGMTPIDQLMCRTIFLGMRYEGLFTAPDTDVSLSYPGSLGGLNWGGISYDPNAGMAYLNDMRLGLWVQLIKKAGGSESDGNEAVNAGMGAVPLGGTPYSVIKDRFLSPLGVPCQKPPFGSMTAIDMKTRSVVWQVPLGTVTDTRLHGVQMGMPMPIGMPTIGGSMVTAGGLVFFAATQDYYLRAFDSSTGKELWKARLPVGSQGTPVSYVVDGKQYIVISAGGARQSPDRGDYVIAFALPQK
jgi:quinate dehydrogenase (quinone)